MIENLTPKVIKESHIMSSDKLEKGKYLLSKVLHQTKDKYHKKYKVQYQSLNNMRYQRKRNI